MGLGASKRVRLHLKDGKSFEGLLVHKRPEFVLEIADLILPGDKRQQIDGRVRVLRADVAFWQELPS